MTGSRLSDTLRSLVPSSLREELVHASNYAWGGSEIIQSICQIKQSFYGAGFTLQLKTSNQKYKESLNDRVSDLILTHEIRKVVDELILDFVSTDNCVLHWAVDGQNFLYITTLNPARCDYTRSLGEDSLKVELDDQTMVRIRTALASKGGKEEILKAYPAKYVEAVEKGKRWVELRNEDGEFWVVRTKARRFSGFARPSMRSIFADIILRETLQAGDWAVAYYLKRVIEHVKAGEKPPSGLLQNLRALYPTKDQIAQLVMAFKAVGQTMRLFTDHTTTIEYPHPPMDIFDPTKFEKVEERILRWGGVIDVLMTGKGEGFSQGHLAIRRFVADGLKTREAIGEVMAAFLLHESMVPVLKIPSGSTVQTAFDEKTLKDSKQVQAELESLWDRGLLDVETFHEGLLGVGNYELIKSRKERDQDDKELWQPLFEKSQGMLGKDGGRPDEGNPKPAPTQRPKPSKNQ